MTVLPCSHQPVRTWASRLNKGFHIQSGLDTRIKSEFDSPRHWSQHIIEIFFWNSKFSSITFITAFPTIGTSLEQSWRSQKCHHNHKNASLFQNRRAAIKSICLFPEGISPSLVIRPRAWSHLLLVFSFYFCICLCLVASDVAYTINWYIVLW